MFKLLRWLFLVAVIVVLLGALVTVRIRGATPAEGACRLWGNPACLTLASHLAVQFQAAERRLLARTHASQSARHESAHLPPRPHAPVVLAPQEPTRAEPARPSTPPLDRHTPDERQALDRILSKGSK